MVVAGIEYLDEDAELFPDGSVHDATLARDTRIEGLPCEGGHSVVYFPGGRLRLAWLAAPADIGVVSCGVGIVYLHPNGSLLNAALSRAHSFGDLAIPAGERVTLDEGGRLIEHSRTLASDECFGGLLCAAAFRIWLYPNGGPSVVVLAAPTAVSGTTYARGSELLFDKRGRVIRAQAIDMDAGHRYKQRVFGVFEASLT